MPDLYVVGRIIRRLSEICSEYIFIEEAVAELRVTRGVAASGPCIAGGGRPRSPRSGCVSDRGLAVSGVFCAADRVPVQFSEVVDGGIDVPLAAAALEAAHAEAAGALPVLHLPEDGFDRRQIGRA